MHVDHVDPEEPIILATPTNGLRQFFPDPEQLILIDGAHRIARALKVGQEIIRAYVLDGRETGLILRHVRPTELKSQLRGCFWLYP